MSAIGATGAIRSIGSRGSAQDLANIANPVHLANRSVVIVALLAIATGTSYLSWTFGWRQGALFVVGAAAGVVLYHAAFGFTSSWRAMIVNRRGAGLRAQLLMLAVTSAVFFPAIAAGSLFGETVRGSIAPIGLSVVAGAFLFGIGMQLGGGCASGTLYTAGGGSLRMCATLAGFIAGSVIGVIHMPRWEAAPTLSSVSLVDTFGVPLALGGTFAVFGALAVCTVFFERRRHGSVESLTHQQRASVMAGPWPLAAGAIGLAAVNIATLCLAGRPWGVTSAFALWGSKALAGVGVDVASWPYWQARSADLSGPILADINSVMDVGIMIGALAAAGLAGRFAPAWRIPLRSLAAALGGGLLLGYGSRIAYGCNIGAFFSGVASSSVHGWVWFVAAFVGSIIGTRLRPFFGLRI